MSDFARRFIKNGIATVGHFCFSFAVADGALTGVGGEGRGGGKECTIGLH